MMRFCATKHVATIAQLKNISSAVFFSSKVVKKGAANPADKRKRAGEGKKSSAATILEKFFETAELAKRHEN